MKNNLEIVADYNDLCGECPVWDAATSCLYWTDLSSSRFYRYDRVSGRHELVCSDFQVTGFRRNRSGGFAVVNNQGVWLWDSTGKRVQLCGELDGAPMQLNDCTADPNGRLLTGTQFYDPGSSYGLGKLVAVDNDGQVRVLDQGFHLPNGLAFSPDARTLYFTDTIVRRIYAYDYDVQQVKAVNRRTLIEVPSNEGLPDGLTVDAEGFLWSAQWYGSCVVRYDPEGHVERRIQTTAKQTSAMTFGGGSLDELYITTAGHSEPMPVMPPGYDPYSGYIGGALFRAHPGVCGKPEFPADLRLSSWESDAAAAGRP